jgi:undecaprenyl-diphosphatase
MGILDAILLGIIEGLTELLPVSSTGHLVLVSRWLGHEGEAHKALDVVIQLGAVIAVALYFRARLRELAVGLWTRRPDDQRLGAALAIAFVPTALAGLLLNRLVKEHLFAPLPVAAALIVGGVVMIVVERWRPVANEREGLGAVTWSDAAWVGLAQCLALWPGASRSMTTIVGGQLSGLSTRTAAEFSFLLAIPTLGAATVYDFVKHHHLLLATWRDVLVLAIGLGVSFAVTWLVVAVFLRYVSRVGLSPFGLYRIVLGILVLLLWPAG